MNSILFRRLSTVTIIGFLGCVIWIITRILSFEDNLQATEVVDSLEIMKVRPMLQSFFVTIGILISTGLLSIIFLLSSERNRAGKEKVVIENFTKDHDQQEKSKEEELQEEFSGLGAAYTSAGELINKLDSEPNQEIVQKLLIEVCNAVEAAQGALFLVNKEGGSRYIELFASYAYTIADSGTIRYEFGDGVAGQVAKEGKKVQLANVPNGYITILSGLGDSSPTNLLLIPILGNDKSVFGVVEIATFHSIPSKEVQFVEEVFNNLGERLSSTTV